MVRKEGSELANDTTLTAEEKEAIEFNQNIYGEILYMMIKKKILSKFQVTIYQKKMKQQ